MSATHAASGVTATPATNPSIADLVARAHTAAATVGQVCVIGIDGPAGSGKTTLADRLGTALPDAGVVHLDDLVPGWDGLAEAAGKLVTQILQPLSAGRDGRYESHDWIAGAAGPWRDVPAQRFVVVEGVSCGTRSAARHLGLLLFVEAPLALRYERGIARDGETFRPHWERWAAQEVQLFARERTRERAEVIIDGSLPVPD